MDPTTYPPARPLSAYSNGLLKLYHLESSMSIRVLWALEELALSQKGFRYEMKSFPRVRIEGGGTPGIFEVSPMGLAPVLEVFPNDNHHDHDKKPNQNKNKNKQNNDNDNHNDNHNDDNNNDNENNNDGDSDDRKESTTTKRPSIILSESRLILEYIRTNYDTNQTWTTSSSSSSPQDDAFYQQLRDIYFTEFSQTALHRIDFVLVFDMIRQSMPFPLRLCFGWIFGLIAAMMMKTLPRVFQEMDKALAFDFSGLSTTTTDTSTKKGTSTNTNKNEDGDDDNNISSLIKNSAKLQNKAQKYPWFSGSNIGIADFMMSFPMDIALQRGYLDLNSTNCKYPALKAWNDRRLARRGWKNAMRKVGRYDLVNF